MDSKQVVGVINTVFRFIREYHYQRGGLGKNIVKSSNVIRVYYLSAVHSLFISQEDITQNDFYCIALPLESQ